MPFDIMMLSCLSAGRTFTEAGHSITINPENGENILLFVIDEKSNRASTLRNDLRMRNDEPICDGIYYYMRGERKVICFIELKGGDVGKAVEQIVNTKTRFISELNSATHGKLCNRILEQIQWKAYICIHGSAPKELRKYADILREHFPRNNFLIHRQGDIGQFIRG